MHSDFAMPRRQFVPLVHIVGQYTHTSRPVEQPIIDLASFGDPFPNFAQRHMLTGSCRFDLIRRCATDDIAPRNTRASVSRWTFFGKHRMNPGPLLSLIHISEPTRPY